MLYLDQLEIGQWARVVGLDEDSASASRLASLGFLPGRLISLSAVAPMGDPILVALDGQRISVRRSDARSVRVCEEAALGEANA